MKTAAYGVLLPLVSFAMHQLAAGIPAQSDGSDGPFHPGGNITINLNEEAPDGVLHYTTINIPEGVTVYFSPNASNTPVFLAATGNVVIAGTVSVSAGAAPGGYGGGTYGTGAQNGTDGEGPGGGEGGYYYFGAGGGAGMANVGMVSTNAAGAHPGDGGPVVPRPDLTPGEPGGGGSGGGGGAGTVSFGVGLRGGSGGVGGGALQISTPEILEISGILRANGGNGHYAFANVFTHGGPGAGGSGGTIELYADTLIITSNATIYAEGGDGSGFSTERYPYSRGNDGSIGYLTLHAENYNISPLADIHDISMWPYPFGLTMEFASTNEQYQLQYADTLVSNVWNNISLPLTPGTHEINRTFSDITTAGTTNRFYRLITIPE